MDELEKLSDEDVERIAKKIMQMKHENNIYGKYKTKIAEVKNKYHWDIYGMFGATGVLESAIRTTALLLAGYRKVSELPVEKVDEVCSYMEELYKRILKEENNND